jgi:putative transposase
VTGEEGTGSLKWQATIEGMPWKESRVPDQRYQLIQEYEAGESISALAEIYGVSRKTVYKWIARHESDGLEGLEDRSRRPHCSPTRVSAEIEEAIIAARLRWKWGPRKLLVKLREQDSSVSWPHAGTIAEILKRKGLVRMARKRARTPPYQQPFAEVAAPNQVWCADFKGWFRTADGTRIDPLTITDASSRYLLRCQAVERMGCEHAHAVFEAAFREYGLPQVMHTDNGVPFASVAPGGLSRLSMWWVKLGIVPERSRPASPQENGRHERMHLTLKQATAQPPKTTRRAQEQAFQEFQRTYNEHRPHEALDYRTPASCYQASQRVYPRRVPELEYDNDMQVRRISQQGSLKWQGERTFISEVFAYEYLGLKAIDERWREVLYGPISVGWFDTHCHRFHRMKPRSLRQRTEERETHLL